MSDFLIRLQGSEKLHLDVPPSRYFRGQIASPIGPLDAVVNEAGAVVRLDFHVPWKIKPTPEYDRAIDNPSAMAALAQQVSAYFEGQRKVFDLPLAPNGSAFMQAAWTRLRAIPYGTTTTYGELARGMDKPTSARAMGLANAMNPISIIVPCHRVIGTGGKLTGYGGGLEVKRALLLLEAEYAGTDLLARP